MSAKFCFIEATKSSSQKSRSKEKYRTINDEEEIEIIAEDDESVEVKGKSKSAIPDSKIKVPNKVSSDTKPDNTAKKQASKRRPKEEL